MLNVNWSSHKRPLTILFISVLLVCLVASSLIHVGGGNTDDHGMATGQVDLDISHTIVCIFTPSPYNATYISRDYYRMVKGCINRTTLTGDGTRSIYKFNIHVSRLDHNPNMLLLQTAIYLNRTDGFTWIVPNWTSVLLAGGADVTVELDWCEVGYAYVPLMGTEKGKNWTVGAGVAAINTTAYDSDLSNNVVMDGGNYTAYYGLAEVGDLLIDGVIDIFDAIKMSGYYGVREDTREVWHGVLMDLWPQPPLINLSFVPDPETGLQIIDIYDAIILSANFGRHMP